MNGVCSSTTSSVENSTGDKISCHGSTAGCAETPKYLWEVNMTCPRCSSPVIHKPGSFLVLLRNLCHHTIVSVVSALDSTEVGASAVSSVADLPTPEMLMEYACCSVTFPAEVTYGVLR